MISNVSMMVNEPTQQTESTSRWVRYIMLAGLAFLLSGIVAFSLAQDSPGLTDAAKALGYLGLALFLISFLIHVSLD